MLIAAAMRKKKKTGFEVRGCYVRLTVSECLKVAFSTWQGLRRLTVETSFGASMSIRFLFTGYFGSTEMMGNYAPFCKSVRTSVCRKFLGVVILFSHQCRKISFSFFLIFYTCTVGKI